MNWLKSIVKILEKIDAIIDALLAILQSDIDNKPIMLVDQHIAMLKKLREKS